MLLLFSYVASCLKCVTFLCGIMCTMPLFIIKCNYEFIIMSFTHKIKLIHNENTEL